MIEEALELGGRHGVGEHGGRAVGEDRRDEARLLQPAQDMGTSGKQSSVR